MKGARTVTEPPAARKAFLSFTNRCFSFIIIIFGAAAIGDLSEWLNVGNPAVFAAVTTAAATLQLVFDFGGRAALHDYLQRRYYWLRTSLNIQRKKSLPNGKLN